MTDLIPFEYSGRQVRTTTRDGEPWFVAADVCAVLGIRDTYDATRGLDDDEKGTETIRTPGGPQAVTIVSEPGLYSLILRSRKPEAKPFKRWVTHEVLPALRKTGRYSVTQLGRRELAQMVIEAEDRAALAEQQVKALEPAAHAWDTLAGEEVGDYSLRDAAQILNRDPAIATGQNRLMKTLHDLGWVDRKGKPYQREIDAGRLACRMLPYEHPHTKEPQLGSQVRVTPKGLRELHKRLGGERPLQLTLGGAR
ncbi:BRO family protein [Amycolatopsis taiwanensis]|uniref:BRO family protein n=1 Tax=Amycolatopsis taiwanensis TaxID=342230 RepID=UPI0004B3F1FB|nr:BRO family protein [Amycolatopsis taiwanensis]